MEENLNQSVGQNITPPTEPVVVAPIPPANQPPFGGWRKLAGLILGTTVLAVTVFFAGYQYSQKQTAPVSKPNPTPVVVTTPTPNPTENWKTHAIDLYKLQLSIPSNWTIQEINRRPEPTREFDPKTGHDCADYLITSQDNYVKLSLKPTCGFAEGLPNPWPKDTIVVKELGNDSYLIRYFDAAKSAYIYAHGGEGTFEDERGKHQEKTHTGALGFGTGQNLVFIFTEMHYSGPDTSKELYLRDTDKVVISLKLL